jgi:CSLREA domain-containing protein
MRGFGAIVLSGVVMSCLVASSAAGAAVITVDTTDDASAVECTLRDAITAANDDSTTNACPSGDGVDDTIRFSFYEGTVELNSPLPSITEDLQIEGNAPNLLVIRRADTAPAFRIIDIESAADEVGIAGVGIANGLLTATTTGAELRGAGIRADGANLVLNLVTVRDNRLQVALEGTGGDFTAAAQGAGIRIDDGSLAIDKGIVSGNHANVSGVAGGAGSTLNVGVRGVGIYAGNSAALTRTRVTANTGMASAATAGGTGSAYAVGGGMWLGGDLVMTASTFDHNTITGLTLPVGGGGGLSAGGGAHLEGSGGIVNSTFAFNEARSDKSDENLVPRGGGISVANEGSERLDLFNSTVGQNRAVVGEQPGPTPDGANLAVATTAKLRMGSTIVSDPIGGGVNCVVDGAIESEGFNLEGFNPFPDDSSCGLTESSDLREGDAGLLDQLIGHGGGWTPILAWNSDLSAAWDAGFSFGETVDQTNGARRVDYASQPNAVGGDGTDIGAFELPAPIDPCNAKPGWCICKFTPAFCFRPPSITGKRARALKKCKRKRSPKKRRKCRKKARKLPV